MKVLRKSKIKELTEFDKGFNCPVIGTDEAGRGPIAGPVVASAVYFPEYSDEVCEAIKFLDDSKKLSPTLRKELSEQIKKVAVYCIAECTVEEIEQHNILQASLLAMRRACEEVILQLSHSAEKNVGCNNEILRCAQNDNVIILVDGKFTIPRYKQAQQAVKKGDSLSASIAAASILAKVHRDKVMAKLAEEYPVYDWCKNKGYPTRMHIEAVREHGFCELHRKNFCIKKLI